MKTLPIFLLSSVLAGSVLGQNNAVKVAPAAPASGASTNAPADPGAGKFKTDLEKHSYAMGVLLAGDIKRQLSRGNYEHDAEIVIKAFSEALRGKPTVITDGEANVILRNYSTEIRKKAEEKRKEDGEKAKVAGEAFLAANKSKEGVQVTASGLQYKVLKAAEGAKAKGDDVVEVHYRGTLVDGTEFDSSYSRGQPASFGLSRVIKGWTEGLQLMPVGSKYQFVIPSELAYGQNGSPPKIPPHSTLIFEVDLLSVKPQIAPPLPSSVTSDIIKVPSADDLKKGAQIEVIKSTDAERLQKEAAEQKKSPRPLRNNGFPGFFDRSAAVFHGGAAVFRVDPPAEGRLSPICPLQVRQTGVPLVLGNNTSAYEKGGKLRFGDHWSGSRRLLHGDRPGHARPQGLGDRAGEVSPLPHWRVDDPLHLSAIGADRDDPQASPVELHEEVFGAVRFPLGPGFATVLFLQSV